MLRRGALQKPGVFSYEFFPKHILGVTVGTDIPLASVTVELASFKPRIVFVCCLVRFVVDIVLGDSGNFLIGKEWAVRRYLVKSVRNLLGDATDLIGYVPLANVAVE